MQISTVTQRLTVVNSDFPELSAEDRATISKLSMKDFQAWHYHAKNLNKLICRSCFNDYLRKTYADTSDQLAANIRNLRVKGFDIPKEQRKDCTIHGSKTADLMRSLTPVAGKSRLRFDYAPNDKKRMLAYFDGADAYDYDKTQAVELDHRIPMSRADENEKPVDAHKEAEVRKVFMPLTRVHNLQKDRACQSCISTNRRPPFLGIKFWSKGNETYNEALGCTGCGWAYPEEWREALQKKLD
jgi:hypothetical protein